MKRGIAVLLAVLLLLPLLPARASATGGIRHQVYGDVSSLEVDEKAGLSESDTNGSEAKIGTDVYLFVDPDTASYVTFYVTDEQGNPLKNAQIYLTYQGITEFFGTTGANGKFESYLFRNVDYGFTIKLSGYETAVGSFNATEELAFVHVVLRKYYGVDIFILDGGVPKPGTTVIIDGEEYTTDEDGKIRLYKTNGEYTGVVITPDGREVVFRFTVNSEDTAKVVDIGKDETLVKDGIYYDSFLVYDRDYLPEDYELTYFQFAEEDLQQKKGETDQDYEKRVDRYLQSCPSAVVVQAQPDRKQNPTGKDTDILDSQKRPVYSQRSMMPSGYLLKAWEEEAYSELIFKNGEMGLRLNLEELHNPELTKVFALAWYLTDEDVRISDIFKEEIKEEDYGKTGIFDIYRDVLDWKEIDLSAIRDFEFSFVHEALEHPKTLKKNEKHNLLADSLYTNTTFEFRLTPITRESLREMIYDGLDEEPALELDSIMVANYSYFLDTLRRWRAEGNLDDHEAEELYAFVVDGKLTAKEIEEIKKAHEEEKLSQSAIDALLDAAMEEKLYRVSCWIHYRDVVVNITELLDSLELIRNVDAQFHTYYQQLDEENRKRKEEERREEDALIADAETLLKQSRFLLVDNDAQIYDEEDYKPGDATKLLRPVLTHAMVQEDTEFYDVISNKQFQKRIVDVRLEDLKLDDTTIAHYMKRIEDEEVLLEQHRALICKSNRNALTGLVCPEYPPKKEGNK